ncbi:MAG: hypothetical protein AB1589_09885 [Cyanobacteriota bacterium]
MEDINNRGSVTATFEKRVIQPRLIVQALAFTGILYFCVGQAPPDTGGTMFPSVRSNSTALSRTVSHTVLQHASQQSGLPTSDLKIVQAHPQTWSDSCLELGDSKVSCTQISVSGWQITVASKQNRWIYRTDQSGSVIKLKENANLPNKVNEVAIAPSIPTKN